MDKVLAKIKEEPALLTMLVQAILGGLVAFNVVGFTEGQTGAILAAVSAVGGVIVGMSTTPFRWGLVTGLAQSAVLVLSEFGFSMNEEQVGSIYLGISVIGVLVRKFITPHVHVDKELPA